MEKTSIANQDSYFRERLVKEQGIAVAARAAGRAPPSPKPSPRLRLAGGPQDMQTDKFLQAGAQDLATLRSLARTFPRSPQGPRSPGSSRQAMLAGAATASGGGSGGSATPLASPKIGTGFANRTQGPIAGFTGIPPSPRAERDYAASAGMYDRGVLELRGRTARGPQAFRDHAGALMWDSGLSQRPF